jgi:hypothetical protein
MSNALDNVAKLRQMLAFDQFVPGNVDTATTDCTSYLVAAIAAASGQPIAFAAKTYRFNTLQSNPISQDVQLVGMPGKTVFTTSTSGYGVYMANGAYRVLVDGITFQNFNRAIAGNDTSTVFLASVRVANCKFIDCATAVRVLMATEFICEENEIQSSATSPPYASGTGFFCRQTTYAQVARNRINRIRNYAILIGENDDTGASIMQRYVVTGNVITNVQTTVAGQESNAILLYGDQITVANNLVNYVLNVTETTGNEAIYLKSRWATITGNVVIDGGKGESAIILKGRPFDDRASAPTDGGWWAYENIISNNIVYFTPAYSTTGSLIGITANAGLRNHVINNLMIRCRLGLYGGTHVIGNVFQDARIPVVSTAIGATTNGIAQSGRVIFNNNRIVGKMPSTPDSSRVLVFDFYGPFDGLTINNNVIDLDMDGFAPVNPFYTFWLDSYTLGAQNIGPIEICNNFARYKNLTAPASSGAIFSRTHNYESVTFANNDVPRFDASPEVSKFAAYRAYGNASNAGGQTSLITVPVLEPGTTNGKVKLSAELKWLSEETMVTKAITDDLWDLTAVTTAAGQYKKVVLCLNSSGTASIKEGAVATSANRANVPYPTGGLVSVGFVSLGPSYAGGAITASWITPFVGQRS